MKNSLWIFAALILSLSSCSNTFFRQPQPQNGKALSEIPELFHGKFVGHILQSEKVDTVTIGAQSILLHLQKKDNKKNEGLFKLDSNLVLNKQKKLYFVNLKGEEKNEVRWICYIAQKPKGKSFELIPLYFEDEKNLKIASEITKVDTVGKEEYLLDPSKKELKKLIKKGAFSQKIVMKRIGK